MTKRLFAALLCLLLVLALLPVSALAASTIHFTTQPEHNTFVTCGHIAESLTAQASVSPSGTAALNWYACSESGVISGDSLGTGESFTIPIDLSVDVYFYLCQATSEGAAPVNSNVTSVRVSQANEISPTLGFTTHPAPSTTVEEGSISGSLTVEAKVVPLSLGLTPDLEWYACNQAGISSGSILSTSDTFTIPADLTPGTYYYKCKAYCEDTSPTVAWTRVAAVTVLDSDAETVTTPTFSISGGTYTSAQSVTLSCATPGVTVSTPMTAASPPKAAPCTMGRFPSAAPPR